MGLKESFLKKGKLARRDLLENQSKGYINPWPGLAAYSDPYTNWSSCMFCGRDKESFEMTRMIDDNILVTLYGKSGNGKTSLLNAGVFPRLRQMNYFPISVRLGTEIRNYSFQESIISAIEKNIKEECRETIWVIPPTRERSANFYLWNYFARQRFYSDANHTTEVYPVIVLDQFEEVYRSRKEEADVLLRQISYLMDHSHELESCEVDERIYEYEYNFRFVISIREDDLFLLEDSIDYNYLTEMKQTRYRLLPITSKGARDVILNPVKDQNLFAPGEINSIVNAIIGIAKGNSDSISSNVLSLICNRVYAHYQVNQGGNGYISYELVEQFVSGNPLEKFYLEATKDLSRKQKSYLEDNFVDSAERRTSVTRADFDDVFKEKGENLLNGSEKIVQESNDRVELIHDSFCRVLIEQKAKRTSRWRTVFEVAALALMTLLLFLVNKVLSDGFYIPYVWCVFLYDVACGVRGHYSSYSLWISALLLICPFLFVAFVSGVSPLPVMYYPLAGLLGGFLVVVTFFTRKNKKTVEEEEERSILEESLPLRVFLFVSFFSMLIWPVNSYLTDFNDRAWLQILSFAVFPALFLSFFEKDENDMSFLLGGLFYLFAIILYGTSDTEFLKLNLHGFFEYLIVFGGLWILFLFLKFFVIEDRKNKVLAIIRCVLYLALVFGVYSLLYKHKFVMLIIGSLAIIGFLTWVDWDKKALPKYITTFIFTLGLYVFMQGYSPFVKGIPDHNQADDWWWNNVIVHESDGFHLKSAKDGNDLLSASFNKHSSTDILVYQPQDSIAAGYTLESLLICFYGSDKELTYKVKPKFESFVYSGGLDGDIVALVFQKARQRIFNSMERTETQYTKEDLTRLNQLINSNKNEVIQVLDKDESHVKKEITRLLCKGLSCSWIMSCMNNEQMDNELFISYLAAVSTYVRSYFTNDLLGTEDYDWDGLFEFMAQSYMRAFRNGYPGPRDQYLSEVLPQLIDYYLESVDTGLDNLLYGKILRMQQMAIYSGLGDNKWAHTPVSPPLYVDIKGLYQDYRNSLKAE